jgi:hypothetical protein
MSIYLGDFDLETVCTADGCESPSVSIIVLHDTEDGTMNVCCFCLPHAIHHKSQFESQDKN